MAMRGSTIVSGHGSLRYTRVRRDTTASRADTHVVSPRPKSFDDWWAWGVSQAKNLFMVAPLGVHSQSGDRLGWGNASTAIIRGLPFSKPFLAHALRERQFESGAFTRGMRHLYSRTARQTDEFRICYALVSGHTDPEIVRAVILGGPHKEYFEATSVRALEFVYEKILVELAAAKDPDAPAGAA